MAKKKNQTGVTVGFIALGCPKNVVDSERMLAEIAKAGLLIDALPDRADVIVINTCAFIAPAVAEAIEAIKNAVNCKRGAAVRKVVVAGCLVERLGRSLFNEVDGIDAIVGLGRRDSIGRIIKRTLASDEKAAYLTSSNRLGGDDRCRLLIGPAHRAYLRISEGCSHRCSFCTIPSIRGRFRSKTTKLVLAEAAELIAAGAVELNIIGQDTTNYGRDLKIKNGLVKLLKKLEQFDNLKWLRLMYLYPAAITKQLIESVAAGDKIVHYMDIPIQHISDTILKHMHRPDSKDRIYKLIENLRSRIDDVVLRTTLIVGFPGETDRRFDELLEFVRWAGFDALGCFKYYPETGTKAAQMKNQVPDKVKQQRLEELMLAQQKIVFEKNKSRIGGKLTCLVDSVDVKAVGRGRFYGQAPDVDSLCVIKNCTAQAGDFIDAKVVATQDYDLIVEQVQH